MITFGIQGTRGSFNEEACKKYCECNRINEYRIKYLITADNVLKKIKMQRTPEQQRAFHIAVWQEVEAAFNDRGDQLHPMYTDNQRARRGQMIIYSGFYLLKQLKLNTKDNYQVALTALTQALCSVSRIVPGVVVDGLDTSACN